MSERATLKFVVLSLGVVVGLSAGAERSLQTAPSPVEQLKALQDALRQGGATRELKGDAAMRKFVQTHCRDNRRLDGNSC
jgi:hypothetical protein